MAITVSKKSGAVQFVFIPFASTILSYTSPYGSVSR